MISKEEHKKNSDALLSKVNSLKCPMCSKNNFQLMDGYFGHMMHNSFNFTLEGTGIAIPFIAAYCSHCGFVAQFNTTILGLS